MPWFELSSADDARLTELAERYHLHTLHLEDVRSADERIKVEQTSAYTFAVLKPVKAISDKDATDSEVTFSAINIFAGHQHGEPFFITIADPSCPTTEQALARARRDGADDRPARLLYLIMDTIVDLYFPAIDRYDDRIDDLEDRVVGNPEPDTLKRVFAIKRQLIDLRRVLVGTRDAALHLQRDPESIVDADHQPFIRDIYDHVVRLLDSVETQRDLVNNSLDIYLSSVANRTNEVMKVLTVLGTISLPAVAISGIYGMNVKGLPFEDSTHGALIVAGLTIACTLALLALLKRRNWF
jgi:magnesium transporter